MFTKIVKYHNWSMFLMCDFIEYVSNVWLYRICDFIEYVSMCKCHSEYQLTKVCPSWREPIEEHDREYILMMCDFIEYVLMCDYSESHSVNVNLLKLGRPLEEL